MSFKIINKADNRVLHKNTLTENDFNPNELKDEWLHMKHPYGEMKMKQWIFDGVRIGYSDSYFSKPVTLDWEGTLDVVTMHFNLKGGMSINGSGSHSVQFGNNEQNMFYGNEASGSMKVDELHLKQFMVQFNKEAFLRIAGGGSDTLKYFADQVANNKTAAFSNKSIPIDIATQSVIDAVLHCKFSDSLKRVFFLSKVMELMVLQADAHIKFIGKKSSYLKSDYDKDRIIFARDYLLQHIDMPPTIPELSKIAGINEFKLKKGYKEIFGTTIFGHLAEARLQLAHEALKEGKKSASEIAFELGYSSIQHFSTAFKKRFKKSPASVSKLH
jgi:AraC family transcriptional regulator, transcriptional activator of the genes for pyochelin and ferripyochelin receptors